MDIPNNQMDLKCNKEYEEEVEIEFLKTLNNDKFILKRDYKYLKEIDRALNQDQ